MHGDIQKWVEIYLRWSQDHIGPYWCAKSSLLHQMFNILTFGWVGPNQELYSLHQHRQRVNIFPCPTFIFSKSLKHWNTGGSLTFLSNVLFSLNTFGTRRRKVVPTQIWCFNKCGKCFHKYLLIWQFTIHSFQTKVKLWLHSFFTSSPRIFLNFH